MLKELRCAYCGALIKTSLRFCENCGAPNPDYTEPGKRTVIPETIDQLKDYCSLHHIPLKDLHFHIGEDYRRAKAIGIYQDGTDFVVYKNKSDASRFIRYRGSNEAYAVKELFAKLQEVLSRFE